LLKSKWEGISNVIRKGMKREIVTQIRLI